MPAKQGPAVAADVEIVFSLEADAGAVLPRRLAALRESADRAGLRVEFALVCATAPAGIEGLRAVAAPSGHGSQAALLLAAADSRAKALLFLPGDQVLDSTALLALTNASKEFDWVFAPRGSASTAASWLLRVLGLSLDLDLNAPSMIRRERLKAIANGLSPGDLFIAVRLVRAAKAARYSIGLLPGGTDPLSLGETLGLDIPLLKNLLKKRVDGLTVGSALVAAGIALKQAPALGLAFFGLGTLCLGYFFGKSE